ncbi:NERD domain-containing protein [Lentibacillus cibarius]|uniref:NERD domain-containing protein n=1 Tax=Lentibacillus cibarius TaxID=2583219 RepID=A0A549YFE4_9BACI|nr:nuclease-related domain-containing protein [Lentibacillus cibarius]TRM10610.1 NERD domain-containing protein [Lentibacillus cibarius]
MILKNRTKPRPLVKLDAAIPRTPSQFPLLAKMKEDAKIRQLGYTGERKVDYHLDNLAQMFTILHDVYLCVNGKNTQMDSVIIANHSIATVDDKNYHGTITFNTLLKQLTRDDGQTEAGFEYPITQVHNQQFHLQNWLAQQNMSQIPVNSYVAIADPSTIIKVHGDEKEIAQTVAHGAAMPKVIMEQDQQLAKQGARKLPHHQIGKKLLHACGEFDIDIMKKYGLKPSAILPGVICPDCEHRGMARVFNGWSCPKCQCHSKNAHLNALEDYFLLVKRTITNSECMRFLQIPTRGTATRILKSSGLTYLPAHKCWIQPTR